MQHHSSTDLIECLDWKHNHPTRESRRQHALEIIRSGADIHSVTDRNKETCLHIAIKQTRLFDVVQLLLEKGIDANAQDWKGNTALHEICYYETYNVELLTELIPMLLYHGADPWIRNERNATPLDWILKYRIKRIVTASDVEKRDLVETIEHLYNYMFDQYTEFGLSLDALLKAAELNLPFFQEMVGTIKEVDLDNLATTTDVDIAHILSMPPENLRLILDKFDYIFVPLFLARDLNAHASWWTNFRLENVYILVGSHLQREFLKWLDGWELRDQFLDSLFKNPEPLPSREKIVYYLLSYGMEIHRGDIETVYEYCGYKELFKLLRFLDAVPDRCGLKQLIPRLVFEVTGCIQKSIENPRIWVNHINERDFETVLPYYAVRNLKDLCCEIEVQGKENFLKKLHEQPRIPLLLEMARNVFRKYFVQRLGITRAKQFYQSLELLPISPHHRKIIALETELY